MIATLNFALKSFEHYSLKEWRAYFLFLKEHYPIVLPQDRTLLTSLSCCLTFNEPTFAFYHYLFPIFRELKIKVLVGIPTAYLIDSCQNPTETRLKCPFHLRMQEDFFDRLAPFCSWEEVNEMVNSGFIQLASSAHLHCNLTFPFVDLQREVVLSKMIIEKKSGSTPTSFFYPFGHYHMALNEFIFNHYECAFTTHSGVNLNWGKRKNVLNRIHIESPSPYFTKAKWAKPLLASLMLL